MFEIYPTNWPVAVDATVPRNQFHETALHEARVASDYRQHAPVAPRSRGFVARIRLAFAGAAAPAEACTCPA